MKSREIRICSECDEVLHNRDYTVCPECGNVFAAATDFSEDDLAMQTAARSAQRQKLILFGVTLLSLGCLVFVIEQSPSRQASGSFAAGLPLLNQDSIHRSKISSVKANMHTLQTMIETYAIDWGGVYPQELEQVYAETRQPGREYWKDFTNPATGQTGLGQALANAKAFLPGGDFKGIVLYEPLGSDPSCITSYKITGVDPDGELIKNRSSESVYALDNGPASDCGRSLASTEILSTEPEQTDLAAPNNQVAVQATDLESALRSWQQIKREAFLNEDDSRLTEILTGSALEETRGGLKWWADNEARYRDIQLLSLNILNQKEMSPTETQVVVEISETKDNSVDGLKTSTYRATYTLVKQAERWVISQMQAQ